MNKPLVSVVIDNYNYGRYLGEAIDSALGQTYPHTEVVVVDDGSTDGSQEVIARYAGRVRPVLKANGGQASALNAGFRASRGDVVVFLDADDVLLPGAVGEALRFMDDPDVVKVQWPFRIVDEHGTPTGRLFPGPRLAEGDLREHVLRVGPTNHLCSGLGAAWPRSYLEQILPIPEAVYRRGADTYLFELAPFFGVLKALPEPQALYRHHGKNGHTLMTMEEKIERELRFYDNCCEVLKRHLQSRGVQVDVEGWKRHSWWHRHKTAVQEIAALPGEGRPFVLVDDGSWEPGLVAGRRRIPFLEREGQYWGPPPDDETAVREVERLRKDGAALMVFAWPAFWWLDHYSGMAAHLRAAYRCCLENERLVVFDLG